MFLASTIITVQDGQSTDLWNDNWLQGVPRYEYPTLYSYMQHTTNGEANASATGLGT
jgi:hypothetical protein